MPNSPPKFYREMKAAHPELFDAYEALGEAAKSVGPLDGRTAALVKLALSVGVGLEGSTHSSARKALAAGCSPEELRHVSMLGVTTVGFPSTMRARSWIEDVLREHEGSS